MPPMKFYDALLTFGPSPARTLHLSLYSVSPAAQSPRRPLCPSTTPTFVRISAPSPPRISLATPDIYKSSTDVDSAQRSRSLATASPHVHHQRPRAINQCTPQKQPSPHNVLTRIPGRNLLCEIKCASTSNCGALCVYISMSITTLWCGRLGWLGKSSGPHRTWICMFGGEQSMRIAMQENWHMRRILFKGARG
jgi:hypothetical protein